jgi:hypothetical protein
MDGHVSVKAQGRMVGANYSMKHIRGGMIEMNHTDNSGFGHQVVRLSELRGMGEQEIYDFVGDFLEKAQQQPELDYENDLAKREIAAFEIAFGMTSEDLILKVKSSEIEETYDICEWLLLLHYSGMVA